jgi:hypothetical protein
MHRKQNPRGICTKKTPAGGGKSESGTSRIPAALFLLLLSALMIFSTAHAAAEEPSGAPGGGDAGLAQELSNPLADLTTIPFQMNYDREIGPLDDGWRLQTNIQPVVPFHLSEDWNLISRTIIPVISQEDIFPGSGSQFGLGDISVSLFFSPKEPAYGGLIWGVGPILLLPTATKDLLGGEKWGAGPTAVALAIRGPWLTGLLANHIWSYAGNSGRRDVSNTFLQPFVTYTWPSAWTLSVQSESTYDWKTEKWSVPVNVGVAKLVKLGKLPVSLLAGVGYWTEAPDTGPEGFRFRLQASFVLPKLW